MEFIIVASIKARTPADNGERRRFRWLWFKTSGNALDRPLRIFDRAVQSLSRVWVSANTPLLVGNGFKSAIPRQSSAILSEQH
jgi:hypothetical protein